MTPTHSSPADILRTFDHAILHPTLTDAQVADELARLCRYPIASACVKPAAVRLARQTLAGTDIGIGTVIGFPHGTAVPSVKAFETHVAFRDGAREVDMVLNSGKALGGDWSYVRDDINAVLLATREHGGVVKVIFETDYLLEDATKIRLCEVCTELGVDYVKTSTGFGYVKQADGTMGYRGATLHDIELMRRHCGPRVGVKASGGVRTLEDVLGFLSRGVTRIGTTSTAAIYAQAVARFQSESNTRTPADSHADGGY